MMHIYCFEDVDRILRDNFQSSDEANLNTTFCGKVIIFGGDFR